jgi:glycosyltransferase involved in cell wall biosynthesis
MDTESVSLSIVVPLYNEAENIQPLVQRLQAALGDRPGQLEIIFVDDGSTDETLALLKRTQESDSRIRIAHFRRNQGQTAAMAAGFRLARGTNIVTLDGDLQNDPVEIPRIVELLKDADVVCGIRVHRQDSLTKRLSSLAANRFRNWATRDDIIDSGCTLKAYRRESIQNLELYNGMHRFLPTLLKIRGARVTQVPVSHQPRRRGRSKYGTFGRLIKGLGDVAAVLWMKKNLLQYQSVMDVFEKPAEQIPVARKAVC